MTLLADSAYVKNNPAWASHNTYRKRDPVFSGLLLYFTPTGQYVNGYAFKNGQQVTQATQNVNAPIGVNTRSIQKGTARVDEPIYDCTFYYDVETVNGVVVSQTFLFADCVEEQPVGGGTNGG